MPKSVSRGFEELLVRRVGMDNELSILMIAAMDAWAHHEPSGVS
jgi:hypothetical protein